MIAEIKQGGLLDNLKVGGEFEDLNAKAFVVMIFHRWDEQFRHKMAQVFSVPKNGVQCDLLGDVRHIRNAAIHENSTIDQETIDKLKMLPSIWELKPRQTENYGEHGPGADGADQRDSCARRRKALNAN